MAPSSSGGQPQIKIPSVSRQLAFHQLLLAARKLWLVDGLREALANIDPKVVKADITDFVPADVQKILSASGIRDEYVFPLPNVLAAKPSLVGYYRLLLGSPQKAFYASGTGMSQFKSMEARGTVSKKQLAMLGIFCSAMSPALSELVRQLSPTVTARDVNDLPLLTLGAQFQGSNNNAIGKQATLDVFLSIAEIARPYCTAETDRTIEIKNSSSRKVVIALSADPDVSILEQFGTELRRKLAIEIKGGSDRSNAHNRAGEAEKSHQKAKREDFRDFWTIIAKQGLDMDTLSEESPTTTSWFDVTQVLGRQGPDWNLFRSRLCGELGIPESAKNTG